MLFAFSVAGKMDPVVGYKYGEMTKEALTSFCSKHEFKSYVDLAHSSSPKVFLNFVCLLIL